MEKITLELTENEYIALYELLLSYERKRYRKAVADKIFIGATIYMDEECDKALRKLNKKIKE